MSSPRTPKKNTLLHPLENAPQPAKLKNAVNTIIHAIRKHLLKKQQHIQNTIQQSRQKQRRQKGLISHSSSPARLDNSSPISNLPDNIDEANSEYQTLLYLKSVRTHAENTSANTSALPSNTSDSNLSDNDTRYDSNEERSIAESQTSHNTLSDSDDEAEFELSRSTLESTNNHNEKPSPTKLQASQNSNLISRVEYLKSIIPNLDFSKIDFSASAPSAPTKLSSRFLSRSVDQDTGKIKTTFFTGHLLRKSDPTPEKKASSRTNSAYISAAARSIYAPLSLPPIRDPLISARRRSTSVSENKVDASNTDATQNLPKLN